MNYIQQYYKKITNNEFVVSDKVRRIYKHLVDNINRQSAFYFDKKQANRAIDFIETFCRLSKGKSGGKLFKLELWEKAFISAIFGFVNKKGIRQYREAILIVARKNGKSTLAAAIAIYMLLADGEPTPEIYSAATKRDQAKIIWDEAVRMIKKSEALRKYCKCLVGTINCKLNDGTFKPLSSDSNSLDGLNVSCSLIDELHAIKDKNLYDVIIDGMTARERPLSIITSTAGTIRENIFDLKYEECQRIINGYDDSNGYHDERTLPVIYELDSRKEWTNPQMWKKANPALGTVKDLGQLADKVNKAKANPALVKNLLCKDFNIRETASEAYLNFEQLNNTATFDIEKMQLRYGIGGFDLSQTIDLTCATVLFKLSADDPLFYVIQMYWIPEDVLEKRQQEDKVPYDIWLKKDLLRICPGNRIDYHVITKWFNEVQEKYDLYIYKIGYDRYSAQYLVDEIKDNFGENVLDEVIQGARTLSAPLQNLAAELDKKHINYGNNPVLKWCLANLKVTTDTNGNIKPIKNRSDKIRDDGAMSLLDAYVSYERNMEDYLNLL